MGDYVLYRALTKAEAVQKEAARQKRCGENTLADLRLTNFSDLSSLTLTESWLQPPPVAGD
ncbi:hypothetical protein C8R48DRAFT_743539, partial [Suillus tomentosus]